MKSLRLLLFLACLASACSARADSIWGRRAQRYAFLFDDNRARNIGDIFTLVIRENSNIGQREQRDLSKSTDTKGTFNYGGSTSSDNGGRSGSADFAAQNTSSRDWSGSAQFSSDRTFLDRLNVTVVDVLPNGNLVFEGHRTRLISGEKRNLRITGIIRPADLSPQNFVFSEAVANFRVEYYGRGVESSFTNQGYLSRLFNYLWPY